MGTRKKPAATVQRGKRERRRSPAGRRRTDALPSPKQQDTEDITAGPLRICDRDKKVFVYGEEKQLTPKEYELLRILAVHEGQVLSPEELALDLWRHEQRPDTDEVKQYVYLLRKKIEPDPHKPRWIRSVKGFGYLLVIEGSDTNTS